MKQKIRLITVLCIAIIIFHVEIGASNENEENSQIEQGGIRLPVLPVVLGVDPNDEITTSILGWTPVLSPDRVDMESYLYSSGLFSQPEIDSLLRISLRDTCAELSSIGAPNLFAYVSGGGIPNFAGSQLLLLREAIYAEEADLQEGLLQVAQIIESDIHYHIGESREDIGVWLSDILPGFEIVDPEYLEAWDGGVLPEDRVVYSGNNLLLKGRDGSGELSMTFYFDDQGCLSEYRKAYSTLLDSGDYNLYFNKKVDFSEGTFVYTLYPSDGLLETGNSIEIVVKKSFNTSGNEISETYYVDSKAIDEEIKLGEIVFQRNIQDVDGIVQFSREISLYPHFKARLVNYGDIYDEDFIKFANEGELVEVLKILSVPEDLDPSVYYSRGLWVSLANYSLDDSRVEDYEEIDADGEMYYNVSILRDSENGVNELFFEAISEWLEVNGVETSQSADLSRIRIEGFAEAYNEEINLSEIIGRVFGCNFLSTHPIVYQRDGEHGNEIVISTKEAFLRRWSGEQGENGYILTNPLVNSLMSTVMSTMLAVTTLPVVMADLLNNSNIGH